MSSIFKPNGSLRRLKNGTWVKLRNGRVGRVTATRVCSSIRCIINKQYFTSDYWYNHKGKYASSDELDAQYDIVGYLGYKLSKEQVKQRNKILEFCKDALDE